MSKPIYVIAEAGVNHNGNYDMAFKLVDAAIEAGADAVKFQTFKAENLVTKNAVKAEYQLQTTDADETQYAMLKRLELPRKTHFELIAYCKEKNIEFLSTAFDLESLYFLVNDLCLETFKIPSGEITNGPLLLAHAQTGCDLIVSTGMTTLGEIEEALSVIAFGLLHGKTSAFKPSSTSFKEAYCSDQGREILQKKVTLLHCTTEYPAPYIDINLNAMHTMRNTFGLNVGYSDHSEGIIVPTSAAALGATIIEKHFTLNKELPGPDHAASLEPSELKEMVESIRIVELSLGNGLKEPRNSEISNRKIARKSIIAACDISQGDLFTDKNISVKRPGEGKSPMKYWDLLGKKSQKNYSQDEYIL